MSTPTNHQAGRMRRLKALIVKESLQVVRDPSSILIAFVLPLILLFLFGYGVSLDARQVRKSGQRSQDSSDQCACRSTARGEPLGPPLAGRRAGNIADSTGWGKARGPDPAAAHTTRSEYASVNQAPTPRNTIAVTRRAHHSTTLTRSKMRPTLPAAKASSNPKPSTGSAVPRP